MNRLASTLTACALLAVFALTATSAQDEDPDELPESVWVFRGHYEDVNVEHLIGLYSNESRRSVFFQRPMARHGFSFIAPNTGASYSKHSLLQTGLSLFRMTLVDEGGVDVIVPAVEAMRYSTPLLDEEALAEAAPMTFASIVVHLRHVESPAVMGVIRNVTTQQGGLVQPIQARPGDKGAVLVVDYVHNLRKIAAMIRELDRADERPAVRVAIEHADIEEISDAINAIMYSEGIRLGKVASANSIVLSGPPEVVRRAAQLINELDAAAAPAE